MTITLEQFKKFANKNDILWFYNKPKWNKVGSARCSNKIVSMWHKAIFDEFRKLQEEMYLDESFKDALPYIKFQDGELIEVNINMTTDNKGHIVKSNTPVMDVVNDVKAGLKQIWRKNMKYDQKTGRYVSETKNKKREVQMKVNLEIAKICHKVNRDYCIDEQLVAPPKWDELPLNVQESIIVGVAAVIANPKITPPQIHQAWCDYKEEEGWKAGEVKDLKAKIHPNLVAFKDLPDLEKRKDVIFIRTVKREMKK